MDEKLMAKRMRAVKDALEERSRGGREAENLYRQGDGVIEESRIQFLERLKKMGARAVEFSKKKMVATFDDGARVVVKAPYGSHVGYEEPAPKGE